MAELDAEGRLANTYLMLGSDNGFLIGPHRFPHGKEAPYEESIRVPLLVRGPGYTYVEYATGEYELYDLTKDPYELVNQYPQNPALLQQLSARVGALKTCRGSSCQ